MSTCYSCKFCNQSATHVRLSDTPPHFLCSTHATSCKNASLCSEIVPSQHPLSETDMSTVQKAQEHLQNEIEMLPVAMTLNQIFSEVLSCGSIKSLTRSKARLDLFKLYHSGRFSLENLKAYVEVMISSPTADPFLNIHLLNLNFSESMDCLTSKLMNVGMSEQICKGLPEHIKEKLFEIVQHSQYSPNCQILQNSTNSKGSHTIAVSQVSQNSQNCQNLKLSQSSQFIDSSCHKTSALASSNAFSILCKAKYYPKTRALNHIRVPHSNLSGSRLQGYSLKMADLSHCSFGCMQLLNTDLTNANLLKVRYSLCYSCPSRTSKVPDLLYVGNKLVSVSADSELIFSDFTTGAEFLKKRIENEIQALALSPDKETIAVGTQGALLLIRSDNLQPRRSSKNLAGATCLAFSPNGKFIVAAIGHSLLFMCPKTLKIHFTLNSHSDRIHCMSFSPTAPSTLFTGGNDRQLFVHNTLERRSTLFAAFPSKVIAIALSAKYTAVASWDCPVKVWSSGSTSVDITELQARALALLPRKCLACSARDLTIAIWHIPSLTVVKRFAGHNKSVTALLHVQNFLASGSYDGTLKLWDLETELAGFSENIQPINSIAFSPCGEKLACACIKTISFWSYKRNEVVLSIEAGSDLFKVLSIAYSPCGQFISSKDEGGTIKVWREHDGSHVCTLKGHRSDLNAASFSPCSMFIAAGCGDHLVKVWEVSSLEETHLNLSNGQSANVVAFSTDSKHIGIGTYSKNIEIWDWREAALVHILRGHNKQISTIVYSSTEPVLASSSWDRTIKIWNLDSGKCTRTLKGHGDWVSSLVISSCGKYLVSGSWDKTVKVWSVTSGACLKTFTGHTREIKSVALSPSTLLIASGGYDCSIKVWDLEQDLFYGDFAEGNSELEEILGYSE